MVWIRQEGKINDNTFLIDGMIFGQTRGLACYIIAGKEKTVLIDSGGINEAEGIVKKVKNLNFTPDILLLTHCHWDHAAGAPEAKEKFPDLEIMASRHGIESLRNLSDFNEPYTNVTTGLKSVENVTPLKDGDSIDLGELNLKIFETPGHSNCSLSILDQKNEVLFVGDSLGNRWTRTMYTAPIMPPEFSEKKIFSTYEKVKNINYSSVGLSHFGILTDEDAKDFLSNVKEAYTFWRDSFVSSWKKNPDNDFCIKEFSKRLQEKGIPLPYADISAEREGGWILKALKMEKLIT